MTTISIKGTTYPLPTNVADAAAQVKVWQALAAGVNNPTPFDQGSWTDFTPDSPWVVSTPKPQYRITPDGTITFRGNIITFGLATSPIGTLPIATTANALFSTYVVNSHGTVAGVCYTTASGPNSVLAFLTPAISASFWIIALDQISWSVP